MPNLDYAELEKAAAKLLDDILVASTVEKAHNCTLVGLRAIAKRAFEQAARPQMWNTPTVSCERLVIGNPPSLLRAACAALDAPEESAKEKP